MNPTKLERASLAVVDGVVRGPNELRFKFNPSEYTVAKSANWQRNSVASASSAPPASFSGSSPQTLSMEIFLDDWEAVAGDVSGDVRCLLNWLRPTEASMRGANSQPRPPILAFRWGRDRALAGFRGYLKSVSAKYTMFRADGTPVRATASISLEEFPQNPESDPEPTNPTSGAIHGRSAHVLVEGDSLQSVAFREYGDPGAWRGLAAFNEIDDPLRVRPGERLLIPTASEAERLS